MTKKINNPHDKFIKRMMSDQRVAKDFFHQHLPHKIQKLINFNQLTPSQASFVDDHLRLSSADMLFETTFQGKAGYLYLLLEHQSTPDFLMPFRLLSYMLRIMRQHIETYKTKVLPIVYPMVFATTRDAYKGPSDIVELFGEQKTLARKIMFKPFQLIEVNNIPEEALRKHLFAGTLAYTMKHIYDKDILKALKPWMPQFIEMVEKTGDELLSILIRYVFEAGEAVKSEEIVEFAEGFPSKVGEKVMTIAEQLRYEGIERGMKQGMQKSTQEIAKKMFYEGIPLATIAKITGLNEVLIKEIAEEIS